MRGISVLVSLKLKATQSASVINITNDSSFMICRLVSDKLYFKLTVFNFSTDRIRNVEFLELSCDVKLQMYSVAIGT